MNDYKDLIGDIGDCLIGHPSETLCKRILREAADAIEQLVKERGAAVADLGHAAFCDYCKHYCKHFGYPRCKKSGRCEWEWRGVQEV